jgi:hypothetical protein
MSLFRSRIALASLLTIIGIMATIARGDVWPRLRIVN